MGLEIVEMFINFEEEFDISIPDEIASTLVTPRHVIDFLMNTEDAEEQAWSREDVAKRVWLRIRNGPGVKTEQFNEDSYFVEDMGLD